MGTRQRACAELVWEGGMLRRNGPFQFFSPLCLSRKDLLFQL